MMRSTMQDETPGFYGSFPQTFAKESTWNLLALRKSQWLVCSKYRIHLAIGFKISDLRFYLDLG